MKYLLIALALLTNLTIGFAQDTTLVLNTSMYGSQNTIPITNMEGWVFHLGNDTSWAKPSLNTSDWEILHPSQITGDLVDENGRLEGWLRLKFKLDESFQDSLIGMGLIQIAWAATDIYINGKFIKSFGSTGRNGSPYQENSPTRDNLVLVRLETNTEYVLAVHVVDYLAPFPPNTGKLKSENLKYLIEISSSNYLIQPNEREAFNTQISIIAFIVGLLAVMFWLIYFQNKEAKHLLNIAISITVLFITLSTLLTSFIKLSYVASDLLHTSFGLLLFLFLTRLTLSIGYIFKGAIPRSHKIAEYVIIFLIASIGYSTYYSETIDSVGNDLITAILPLILGTNIYYIVSSDLKISGSRRVLVYSLMSPLIIFFLVTGFYFLTDESGTLGGIITFALFSSFPIGLLIYISVWIKESQQSIAAKAEEVVRITEEKRNLLENQNRLLEQQVIERTTKLTQSLDELQATQSQLIHAEKMASLGELTAGIAHEIQNPLNFVNNFSEVSSELLDEMDEEIEKGDLEEVKFISKDIKSNLEKINHHGKRADAIVKGMLAHSRTGKGEKELTDINQLADEYLRLSYHGLRAKAPSFNAEFKTDFDPNLPKINVIPQDIGRVLLNLINNAFQACAPNEHASTGLSMTGLVTITTKLIANPKGTGSQVLIAITDNGPGIPDNIKDKIFQPFFTTKPTGQGTGLGLSLSYDIITKGHKGQLVAESEEGRGSTFTIILPTTAL